MLIRNQAREFFVRGFYTRIAGDNKRLKSIRAIIDTGFTGDLTLPRAMIAELEFTLRGFQEVISGDGNLQYFEMCICSVIWDGQMKQIEIRGKIGEVRITPLPASPY